jgi:hypothetical protein
MMSRAFDGMVGTPCQMEGSRRLGTFQTGKECVMTWAWMRFMGLAVFLVIGVGGGILAGVCGHAVVAVVLIPSTVLISFGAATLD